MIIGVHHIGLMVAKRSHAPWLEHICTFGADGWCVGPNIHLKLEVSHNPIAQHTISRPVNMPGIAHICLQSRDIDEGLARGLQAGLVPLSEPVDLGTPFRYLYAHTDDGILLELEGAPFVRDADPRYWIGHIAFVARDIEPLVGFYARALGLKASTVLRLQANARVDKVAGLKDVDLSAMWLPGLNLGLEFWQYHNPVPAPDLAQASTGFQYLCFECTDFEADCAHVVSQGGVPDTQNHLELTACKNAAFKDPEGNRFRLIAFDDADDPMAIKNLPHRDILARVSSQLV
jgi:catechol 2,3-dioxygenase-like lactoylglutathione lyase family enzyme